MTAPDQALTEIAARGRAAFPSLNLPDDRFTEHIAKLAPRGSAPGGGEMRSLHVEDLFLACAAAHGVPGAMEIFHDRHRPVVASAVRRIDANPAFADDVYQILVERLFTAPGAIPARIFSYAGRGPLSGWVAVAAQRIALSLRGAEHTRARHEQEIAAVAGLAAPGAQGAPGDERTRPIYMAAVREAMASLGDRDRLLLRLTLVEGLSHQRVGRIYGVNQSTVTRWIGAAMDAVREQTYRRIIQDLGIDRDDVESIARSLLSKLDVTLSLILTASPVVAAAPPAKR